MNNPDWEALKAWIIVSAVALIGRVVHYMLQARDGIFRWSWALIWDVPISIGTGVCAAALAQGLGLSGNAVIAVAALAGHLGPQFIKSLLEALIRRR